MRAAAKAQGPLAGPIAVPINDPSITWAKYVISPYPAFADQASARLAVRTERRLELAMEGQRFWDLKRWGVMQTYIAGYLNGVGGGNEKARRTYLTSAELPTAKHDNFPIPTVQVQLSTVDGEHAGSAEHRLVSTARANRALVRKDQRPVCFCGN